MGLILIAASSIPLCSSYLIRRRATEISISIKEGKTQKSQIEVRSVSAQWIVALWIISICLHIVILDLGAYLLLGVEGLLFMFVYVGPLFCLALNEIRYLRMEPLARIELSLERSQSIHVNRTDILEKHIEYVVRTSTHNDEQREALIEHLSMRKDAIGRAVLEMYGLK